MARSSDRAPPGFKPAPQPKAGETIMKEALRPNQAPDVTLKQRCMQRLDALDQVRYSWWQQYRDLAAWINPRLGRFLETPNEGTRGRQKNQRIIDSTATVASQRFASGLMAGVCSPARPWFKLKLGGHDFQDGTPEALWLAETEKRMMSIFAGSNFYRSVAMMFEEIGVFGTGVMLMYEDYEDALRCYPQAAGEYYIAVDNRLDPTTFARKVVMTAEALVDQFGLANCSSTVQNFYLQGFLDQEVLVGHIIMPNDKRVYDAIGTEGMPYLEVYWEWGYDQNQVLREKGYNERPFCCARWNVTGNDPYGRSPGMDAIGDVKQLQVVTKRRDQLVDKLVNPPMTAPVHMKNEPTSVIPGAVTYVPPGQNADSAFKPAYQVHPQGIPAIQEVLRETQFRIKTVFFEDLFLMISQADDAMTATEVVARKEEKMLMLGPPLERLNDELLRVAINRLFGIMKRYKILPPDQPPQVENGIIDVDFVSILAQAQRAVSTVAMERLWQFVGGIAAVKPDVLDNMDADDSVREYADMVGAPPKVVVALQEVQAIRKKRDEAMQQQLAFQNSMEAASGAKTLSETDVGGGLNAIQMMTGTG